MNTKTIITKVKMVVSDFDGIFTDGTIKIYSDGKTSKELNYKDIMAISIFLKANIKFAIISGEDSAAIDFLKNKFNNIIVYKNQRNKLQVLENLLKENELTFDDVLYIGDDINDIEILNVVKYPYTVPNANYKVKALKHIKITNTTGGSGVIREIADTLL